MGYTCLRPNSTGKTGSENVGVVIAFLPTQQEDRRSRNKVQIGDCSPVGAEDPLQMELGLVSMGALMICMWTTAILLVQ